MAREYTTHDVHSALVGMGFTKCSDNNYRRLELHDNMHVFVDEYACLRVNAEAELMQIQIPITMFKSYELGTFQMWLALTDGNIDENPTSGMRELKTER